MNVHRPLTGAERVARRRAALRAQGLRPRTFWLPDTSTPGFQDQARRDCEYLSRSEPEDAEAMAFVETAIAEVLADLDHVEAEDQR